MATNPLFSVHLATESDIHRLMEIQFTAYTNELFHLATNGPNTAPFRQKAGDRLLQQMRRNRNLHTIKCVKVDPNTDETSIVGFCEWFICPHERPEEEWTQEHPLLDCMWIEDAAEREKARGHVIPVFEERRRILGGLPHALLMFLCVDPRWQRQGVGEMLVKWGTGRADGLGIPCFLEASPFGYGLYRKCGFEDVEVVDGKTEEAEVTYPVMLRAPVLGD
jgi:GNAT superfamily N-acetyltransferase